MNPEEIFTVLAIYEAGNALVWTLRYLLKDRLRPKYLTQATVDHAVGATVTSVLFAVITVILR